MTRRLAVVLLVLTGSACPDEAVLARSQAQGSRAPAPTPATEVAGATGSAATSRPAIESWHGIGLRRDPSCDPCCKLVFPAAFGARNPGELQLLREVAAAEGRATELGCNYAHRKQALGHVRALAIQKQDRAAALLILHAKSEGGIDLGGGELAEVFGVDFMVPVLEGYAALEGLLSPELEAHVALNVCSSAYGMVPGLEFNLDRVVRSTAGRGARSLSNRVGEECARILEERTP